MIDTTLLVAYLHKGDHCHEDAKRVVAAIAAGIHGVPITSLEVLDEGLTVLQRRSRDPGACRDFAALLGVAQEAGLRPLVQLRAANDSEREAALRLFFERFDRNLSYTDCVLAAMALQTRSPIASFDQGFDGVVQRIS